MNIEELSSKFSELEKRIKAIELRINSTKAGELSAQNDIKKVSAKEFLLSKNLSSAVEKTLALAYYLEKFEQMKSFNINDISNIFQMAKEKLPINLNDVINKNIKKGHLMEVQEKKDSKKAWVLTSTGERFIEDNFK